MSVGFGEASDPAVQVSAFVGSLADAVAREDPAGLAWLAGLPGRRLVVAVGGVMALHPIGQPSGCSVCASLRQPCLTRDVYCGALAGSDERRIEIDFRALWRRYGGEHVSGRS